MRVMATFDMELVGYQAQVPDGATQQEIAMAAWKWLDDNLAVVRDDIIKGEIRLRQVRVYEA